jgi:hypothetical protein
LKCRTRSGQIPELGNNVFISAKKKEGGRASPIDLIGSEK